MTSCRRITGSKGLFTPGRQPWRMPVGPWVPPTTRKRDTTTMVHTPGPTVPNAMLPGMRAYISREWRERLEKYASLNRAKYLGFARYIEPTDYNSEEVYRRIAFSILSVQTPFDRGCEVFATIAGLSWKDRENYDILKAATAPLFYTETKATGLLCAASQCRKDHRLYLRDPDLDYTVSGAWDLYRRRIARDVYGLGKAKGSFLACLLYPLQADIACLDTWILRRFGFPPEKNGHLTWAEYLGIEKPIRKLAQKWDVSTFVAQWIIWDADRGSIQDHSVIGMPGAHKGTD